MAPWGCAAGTIQVPAGKRRVASRSPSGPVTSDASKASLARRTSIPWDSSARSSRASTSTSAEGSTRYAPWPGVVTGSQAARRWAR